MNTILDGARGGLFILVGSGTQRNKEAERLVFIEVVEVRDVFGVFLDKCEDVVHLKLTLNRTFGWVFEVQIDKNGSAHVAAALFHQIERTALLRE